MNFSLSDEQQMLADSARRFVQGGYQPDTLWRQFAELGWLALPFDEDDGGLGAGLVETMVLLEELGVVVRRPEPLQEITEFRTPFFESCMTASDSVRDPFLLIGNDVIETPPTNHMK